MLVRFVARSQKRTKCKQELGLNSAAHAFAHVDPGGYPAVATITACHWGVAALRFVEKTKRERGLRQQTCGPFKKVDMAQTVENDLARPLTAQPSSAHLLLAGDAVRSLVSFRPESFNVDAFLVSTGIVALAEMGDKTQLLALLLAARFKKPWPIVWGILVATLANHAMAGALGAWLTTWVRPEILRWVLGASFLAMAAWMLVPDKLEDDSGSKPPRWGVFATTVVLFFLAEMGDKTQIATVMLAARFDAYLAVVAGTTFGMMLANAPVVWLGERVTRLVPLRVVHVVSALIFATLGILAFVLPA
jgi:putative Ca2+/H+ antiporter (TMEM165/GDT1 family)